MRKISSVITGLGLGGFALMGVVSSSSAQEVLNSNGWYKACSDQGSSKICNVQYQAVASTGQVVASVNLAEITGEIKKRVFQITVPTDRRIQPGVEAKIDDQKPTKVPFLFCTDRVCAAEVKLDDKLVGVLKGGSTLEIASTNFEGIKTPIMVTLEGFGPAFDGDPIKQEELKKQQETLQKQLQSKAKTLAEKLQEAQDKAKQQAN